MNFISNDDFDTDGAGFWRAVVIFCACQKALEYGLTEGGISATYKLDRPSGQRSIHGVT